jgi:hypothetical protein
MSVQIQLRRDTSENWEAKDPILADGEAGFDITTNQIKVGDGVSRWTELEYISANSSSSGSITVSPTAPEAPSEGDLWFNSTNTITYIYYDGFWIEANPSQAGPEGPQGPPGPAGLDGADGAGYNFELPEGFAYSINLSNLSVGQILNLVGVVGAYKPGDYVKFTNRADLETFLIGEILFVDPLENTVDVQIEEISLGDFLVITTDNGLGGQLGIVGRTGATGPTGNTGPTGPSGVISVTAPITNTGTSSNATLGLDYNALQYGQNVIINGAFDFWQRGTSFTNIASSVYTADRWRATGALNGTITQSTDVPNTGTSYSLRIRPASNGTPTEFAIRQFIERQQLNNFLGKTVTASCWIKSSKTGVKIRVIPQNATGGVDTTVAFTVPANTWTYISASFNTFANATAWTSTPEAAGGVLDIGFLNNTALTTSDDLYVAEAQLELGSVATPFKRNSASIQGELAACQRYYFRGGPGAQGMAVLLGLADMIISYPVPMRATPSVSHLANYNLLEVNVANRIATSLSSFSAGLTAANLGVAVSGGGMTPPNRVQISGATAAQLAFNAEL